MNKTTRLEGVKRRVKPKREVVVYWADYDNKGFYTSPPGKPGAQPVTQAEIDEAAKTKTVILVQYQQAQLPAQEERL